VYEKQVICEKKEKIDSVTKKFSRTTKQKTKKSVHAAFSFFFFFLS